MSRSQLLVLAASIMLSCLCGAPARGDFLLYATLSQSGYVVIDSSGHQTPVPPVPPGHVTGGLARDASGNVYLDYSGESKIHKFSPSGADLGTFVDINPPLGANQQLAFDQAGNLYSSIHGPNNLILKIPPTGPYMPFGPTDLNTPEGLAFDGQGNLYVATYSDNAIRKISPSGVDQVFASTGMSNPTDLAFDSQGNLLVTNFGDNTIRKFSSTGMDLGFFATTGLNGPDGIAIDASGDVYVSNYSGNSIHRFLSDGSDQGDFVTGIVNPAQLVLVNVPEPSSLLLAGLGSIGALVVRRWYRRKAPTC